MPDQKAISTRIAEQVIALKGELVPKVAALRRPVLGNVPVNPEERQRRWWQQAKGWTPEKEQALLASGMTPEDIGLLKYPNREIDARAAGHGDPRKEAEYAGDMSAMGPPAPEPLEAAALATEEAGSGPQVQPSLGRGATTPAPTMAPASPLLEAIPLTAPAAPAAGVPASPTIPLERGPY